MRIALVSHRGPECEALIRACGAALAWRAAGTQEAIRRFVEAPLDALLVNLDTPDLDAVELTRRILAHHRCAILLCAVDVQQHFTAAYEAMSAGALSAVAIPALDEVERSALAHKLSRLRDSGPRPPVARAEEPRTSALVAIGASTGGPQAVLQILSSLERTLPVPIVIVQHVDETFAESVCSWLTERSGFPVHLAAEGDRPLPGTAWLAATRNHLVLSDRGTLSYTEKPEALLYRPSIDVFFHSLVHTAPSGSLAVLLTGMGRDGAEGMKALRTAGWTTIAQDERTSAVFGMPKAAAQLGAATHVLPLERIAGAITTHFLGRAG